MKHAKVGTPQNDAKEKRLFLLIFDYNMNKYFASSAYKASSELNSSRKEAFQECDGLRWNLSSYLLNYSTMIVYKAVATILGIKKISKKFLGLQIRRSRIEAAFTRNGYLLLLICVMCLGAKAFVKADSKINSERYPFLIKQTESKLFESSDFWILLV